MTHRIDTDIEVREDGTFVGKLPEALPAGRHHAVIEFELMESSAVTERGPLMFPVLEFDIPEAEKRYTREDLYGDRA